MRTEILEYLKLVEIERKITNKLCEISCSGENWIKEIEEAERLQERKYKIQLETDNILKSITEEEFNTYIK